MRPKMIVWMIGLGLVFSGIQAQAGDGKKRVRKHTPVRPEDRLLQRLQKNRRGLRVHVLRLGLRAYVKGWRQKDFHRPVLTIIDYSLPSKLPRMWVFDMKGYRLLWREWVTHGSGSGDGKGNAVRFSNVPNSLATSLGLFRVGKVYHGQFGISAKLHGLEPGFNDNAYKRFVVIHGADYASPSLVRKQGRLGRSWGCPSLRKPMHKRIIPRIAKGGALFAYFPQRKWLQHSDYLH